VALTDNEKLGGVRQSKTKRALFWERGLRWGAKRTINGAGETSGGANGLGGYPACSREAREGLQREEGKRWDWVHISGGKWGDVTGKLISFKVKKGQITIAEEWCSGEYKKGKGGLPAKSESIRSAIKRTDKKRDCFDDIPMLN